MERRYVKTVMIMSVVATLPLLASCESMHYREDSQSGNVLEEVVAESGAISVMFFDREGGPVVTDAKGNKIPTCKQRLDTDSPCKDLEKVIVGPVKTTFERKVGSECDEYFINPPGWRIQICKDR